MNARYNEERMREYEEYKSHTKFLPVSSIDDEFNKPNMVVDPTCGIRFSTIINNEQDVYNFLSHFSDLNVFENLGLIEWVNDDDSFYFKKSVDTSITRININQYFDVNAQLQLTKYPEETKEVPLPSEYKVIDLEYPYVLSFYAEETWDRMGDVEIKSLIILPISKMENGKIHCSV